MTLHTTSTNKDQINCIYAGGSSFSNQLGAYLKSNDKDILVTDITKSNLSASQWAEILEQLDKSPTDLFYTDAVEGVDDNSEFSIKDTIAIIAKNPKAFKGAILIHDKQIKHISAYTEALSFFGVDSAGLEKTMNTDQPTIKTQTKDESFI